MKFALALFAIISFATSLYAQQGKIVERLSYQHPDSSVAKLSARETGFLPIENKTEVQYITYLSDGLKIKGYLVQPKAKGNYPCIILCRGGNAFNTPPFDAGNIAEMQTFASWGW